MKIEDFKKGQKILVECEFDSLAGANQAWVLIQGKPELAQLDNIKLDQPQLVVPQFVADWYEENKDKLEEELCYQMWLIRESGAETDFEYWLTETENAIQMLINMHQFGYTVEKEKLYTVEIPNPNSYQKTMLIRRRTGIYLDIFDIDYHTIHFALTEAEIRKDFDWAFRWAKEVTE